MLRATLLWCQYSRAAKRRRSAISGLSTSFRSEHRNNLLNSSRAIEYSPASHILLMHDKHPLTTVVCCLASVTPSPASILGVISSTESNGSGFPFLLEEAAIRAARLLRACCLHLRIDTWSGCTLYLRTTASRLANWKRSAILNHRS